MSVTTGVILAAGRGKRMKSDLPKVVHPVGGRPMVAHVVDALRGIGVERVIVVVGGGSREAVRQALGDTVEYALQEQPMGTGHALRQAKGMVPDGEDMVVLYGDTPLLTAATLEDLVRVHDTSLAAATLLAVELDNPTGYGRIIRDGAGCFVRIVEEADASSAEKAVREVNAGIYCFRAGEAFTALDAVQPNNSQGEYYLVDALPLLARRGLPVEVVVSRDTESLQGVNSRADLAAAEAALRRRVLQNLWQAGVTVIDPVTAYVDVRARVGRDTVIHPFSVIEGASVVGEGCQVGPGAHIRDSLLADGARVIHSLVEGSRVGAGVSVGPFVHLRGGAPPSEHIGIGNFAETKNSKNS